MVPHCRTGKLAPITATAYPDGNIALVLESINGGHGAYRIVPLAERERDPKPRLLNHFSNCADRQQFGGRS